jgi:hypothetical protein
MRTQLLALVLLLAPLSASAAFHLWDITEVYSNADGSVQFVELEVCATIACNNENLLTGHTITSSSETYTFSSDLPATTAGHHFLIATPAFASQPGAVPPDFTFDPLVPPSTTFMSRVADTLNFAGVDVFSYNVDELPTDGVNSLHEPLGSNVRTTAPNSPTNFAGQVGPEPSAWLLQVTGAAAVFGLAHRRARGRPA